MNDKPSHENLEFKHTIGHDFASLFESHRSDCLIAESEDGFSQLGGIRQFLSRELGYQDTSLWQYYVPGYPDRLEPSIGQLADWVRNRYPEVSLVVIPSRRETSGLKGLIIVPHDGSSSYLRFANGEWARPHRDFMYSVTWEALYQAVFRLGAKRPALMHLSRARWGPGFKLDVTYCQVEAALNFQDRYSNLERVIFWDDVPGNKVSSAIDYFRAKGRRKPHRDFIRYSTDQWGISFVTINWQRAA